MPSPIVTCDLLQGARSRLPISPAMEARLRPATSQDSLNSTGSNQELQNQLNSTIAEVEKFAQEIEEAKRKGSVSSRGSRGEELEKKTKVIRTF